MIGMQREAVFKVVRSKTLLLKNTKIDLNIRRILENDKEFQFKHSPDQPKSKVAKKHNANLLKLTAHENKIIAEVQEALSVFEDEFKLPLVGPMTNLIEVFNCPDRYSRRVVRFCKNMSAFQELHQKDHLIILKRFFIEILGIRFAFYWDSDKERCLLIEVIF